MPHASFARFVRAALDAQRAIGSKGGETQILAETQVYIGLNDAVTKKQEFDTARYVSALKRVCTQYGVPFSFDVINGGYIHDNGEYTEERTILLTFIDVGQKTIDEIARDLCDFFRQESVLITTDYIRARSVRGVFTEHPEEESPSEEG